ncbi:unnamed protein product [Leptidea sinapis]|uniref:FP protein C-terminal domain-containing protein n=1 Tax=Leptidea sinapis TaxID=189913 RepID=A0A5E4R7X8_9NEOP|nr:unnamed protein product [Leptidea sinapis]
MHSRLTSQEEKFDAFSNGLNSLQTELADMRKSFQSLRTDLDSVIECSNNIKESNNRNTEVLNDTVNSIGVIQSQIKEHNDSLDFFSKKIEALQVESSSHSYIISDLKNDSSTFDHNFKSLLSKVMQLERISRSHNIEIQAVPERKNENLNTIIKKIFDKISVSLPDDVVISCNRVAKRTVSDRPRTIVVTLMTPKHRDLILSAVHRYNKANPKDMLCSLDLGIIGERKPIYVAENLSPEAKHLHMEARKASKVLNFKYVWVKFGKVYMRKGEHSPAININSLDKLKSIS